MLHAFRHGKSRLFKRYLGHRDEGEARVCEEDEITALIMGPLDYLPAEAIGVFWKAVVEQDGQRQALAFPAGPASRAHMHFWPRRGVEPDLFVELHWPDGERRLLLVEFKWNARLSGDDQLHRQWQEFLLPSERDDAYHLFIAPEISAGLNALSERDIWNGRLLLRPWTSILGVLRDLEGPGAVLLQRWSSQVSRFLEQLGVKRFQGFTRLNAPPPIKTPTLFWTPVNSFAELKPPAVPPYIQHSSSFIWSSMP
ncbi:hypothetical protein [Pseudomonas sp. Fl4BN1]|uniref:hypothetical protein n=1 Tax=Pseudomonas sp. Fl4BN1 TaxID=2697651 RepID=UPI00137696A6|nr:hypothetical protein [Pseudomonas sp. Fl4BN1]NBF10839.1 hypothetical protein [Pseudomonas sp. Fl4BN1]